MIENRKTYRLPFRAKLVFSVGDQVYSGNSSNISAGGIFITLLESSQIVRESVCTCLFSLNPQEPPLRIQGVVKRVIAMDPNPEILPGIAFSFSESPEFQNGLDKLRQFMMEARHHFELAATILASGEPDLNSLSPLLEQMQLPPTLDLGELRFQIERILQAIELVDANNARLQSSVK